MLVLASTYPRWRNDPEPGFVHELCHRLTDRFNVIALVPDAPGADGDGLLDGVEVVRFRYAPRACQTLVNNGGIVANLRQSPWKFLLVPGFVLGQYFAACRLLQKRSVDFIHAHWLIPQGLIAWQLKRKTATPYLVTSHGGDLFSLRGRALEALKRLVADSSSAMTVVSTAMRDEAQRIKLKPPKLAVLPMGVDLHQRFVVDPDIQRAENQLLFVGRLVAKKGLVYLLNAMPQVLAQRPATILNIAGFGPEETALRTQARKLGIESQVNFLGAMPQQDLPKLYRRASVFVAPFIRDAAGDQEGLPVVLMEAIGCGCPVVVGDVAGVRDLLGQAADDICVNPQDTAALASSLLATLEDPQQALSRAQSIRHAVAGRIDWKVIANGYADLISSCI
ncbi:glycosyltransferase family 4 protein [Stenotrophobium rhamnosiphilum]|uniref:Glycosyltransferase family 4 protein n=1 Tax=Stenotrophobium rhamnosiphilum TaxID=2029166 RepID=A0A2T5MDW5_9GAMM|nr:glycosyltransferase family 4 protein [Stenotrophobium rhamnosiphilum]